MKKLVLMSILGIFSSVLFSQPTYQVSGRVTEKLSDNILKGATVKLKGTASAVLTDTAGYYLISGLSPGKFTLIITHIGYESLELPFMIKNADLEKLDASLHEIYHVGNDIVISASRRPETITDAPASIQTIGRQELEQFSGSNPLELLPKVLGLETMRFGVDDFIVNARGLGALSHTRAFQMIDGRNSMFAASPGIMLGNNTSINKEDIERIEVLIGPQTALYGPNVDNVLVNFISKDPRKYPGTTVALSAGNQSQFSGRFRYAGATSKKWAFKLTGEYATGKNFDFADSVKVGGGPQGIFGKPTTIAEMIDHNFRHVRGEAYVYYNVAQNADIIITAGGSKNDFSRLSGAGHNQVKGMENIFLQARYVSPHVFVNVYNVWVNTGFAIGTFPYTRDLWNRLQSGDNYNEAKTYATRITNRLVEKNQRFNAEAQYRYFFQKAGLFLATGVSTQLDRPHAYGNTLVDSFESIKINQFGLVLQMEKNLPLSFRLVAAGRWDHHTNFNNYFSPKIGLIKKIGSGNLRITWGKAYAMPTISMQYAANVRSFFGNLEGITYLPNGSKVADSIKMVTTPLKVERVSTVELGFKGPITKKLYVDISVYDGTHHDFFNQGITVGGRALFVGDRFVNHNPNSAGKENQDGTLEGASFSSTFNYGKVRVYGLDMGLIYNFNKSVSFSVKYSLIGSDITKADIANDANENGYVGEDEKSFNSPSNRVIAGLQFQNLLKHKLFIDLSARYTSQYDFYFGATVSRKKNAGSWDSIYVGKKADGQDDYVPKNFNWGPLGGFISFDLGLLYKFNPTTSLGLNVTNLFNTVQRESPGSPLIGRLVMFELRVALPNRN